MIERARPMASDYTPTTEDIRDEWGFAAQKVDMDGNVVVSFQEAQAQFDRWLAQHDAEVRAAALRTEPASVSYGYDEQFPFVAVNYLGLGFARFTCQAHAEHYAPNCTVINTAPKEQG